MRYKFEFEQHEIRDCSECRFCGKERTDLTIKYYCELMFRYLDKKPIQDWCPLKIVK